MNSAAEKQRKALGKGLSSLLPGRPENSRPPGASPTSLPIEVIEPNPMQPRTVFDHSRLEELANSIRANGIIQPLIVRRAGPKFHIIAGERRWRAAQQAGLREVPVVLHDAADPAMLELALIENLQREDLGPMEIARAFERMVTELGMAQERIAQRTGKDRASVANYLRLLKLPARVHSLLESSRLSMGHAKAILALPTDELQVEIAERAVAQGLSVRQTEALVNELNVDRGGKKAAKAPPSQDPNIRAAIDELQTALGTKVRIVEMNENRGRIEIEYYSQDQLDSIYRRLLGKE